VEGRPHDEREADLVHRARLGEVAAFEALVRDHQEIAYRAAFLVLGDGDEAADAAQEGFVKAYRALDRFREGLPFRPWLLRIVVNEARNRRRAAGRRAALALRAEGAEPPATSQPSAEASAIRGERRRELLAAVNRLNADDRLVLALRYFLERTDAEAAAILAVPPATFRTRLFRARERLRRLLAAEAGAEGWTDG
jgi:RNA polymerase sigma factor (sigma-70 family)